MASVKFWAQTFTVYHKSSTDFCGEIERFLKLEKVRYLNYNAFWVENVTVGLGSSYETSRVSYHVIMAFIYHVCSTRAHCSDCCDYDQLIIARINMLSIHHVWCTHSSCMCTKHRTLSSMLRLFMFDDAWSLWYMIVIMHDRYDS